MYHGVSLPGPTKAFNLREIMVNKFGREPPRDQSGVWEFALWDNGHGGRFGELGDSGTGEDAEARERAV
jgi:hypothetical protein